MKIKKRKILQKQSLGDSLISVATYVIFAAFAFICVYPFYYIFINTISSNTLSEKGKIIFFPQQIHFHNYVEAIKIDGLMNAALISINRTLIGTVLTVIAAAFLGYMFSRESLWHRKFWYRFVVVTMYFNAGIIPWYLTMRNLHLTNNFWGYVLPTIISPFYIILTKAFVESTPKELQQAAEIDGAGTLTIFFRVIIPVIKPIMATVAIFAAVTQWNSFQDTLLLMTDNKLYSLQFILYQYINQANSLRMLANASSSSAVAQSLATAQTATSIRMTVTIIVVAPILIIYPIFQRYFVKGIMIGAVKG